MHKRNKGNDDVCILAIDGGEFWMVRQFPFCKRLQYKCGHSFIPIFFFSGCSSLPMSRLHIFQKVANVVVYLFFLGATVYSVAGPKPDPKIILQYETYITPGKNVI